MELHPTYSYHFSFGWTRFIGAGNFAVERQQV